MTSWIILLIKQFIDIIKYILIGNAIFDIKFNKKKNNEILFLSSIVILVYIIFYNHIIDIWIELNLIICLIGLLIYFKNNLQNLTKFIIVIMIVNTGLEQTIDLFFNYNIDEIYSYEFIVSNVFKLIITILVVSIIKIFKSSTNKNYDLINIPWYVYMNIIFGFSATLFPLIVVRTYKDIINSRLLLTISAVAYINIIIVLLSISLFVKNKNEKDEYYIDNKMKDQTLKLQESYYKKLIDNYSNLRKFKHDIKGHLNLISGLLYDKDYDRLEIYLKEMSKNLENKTVYSTNNIYISTILNSFDQTFMEKNIKFELSYYITEKLKMDSMDICSLFYNLVLNAIEANLKIKNDRFIKLYIADIKNNMVIKIINPVDENFNLSFIKENITSKQDKENHGLGLITINNIIDKYNGNINYILSSQGLIIDITILNVLED